MREDDSSSHELAQTPVSLEYLQYVALPAICVVISSFLLGYDLGVIAGALNPMSSYMKMSDVQEELLVGSFTILSAVGAPIAASLSDNYGRRPIILAANLLATLGVAIMVLAEAYNALLLGRIIVGIGVGSGLALAPVYLAEITHPSLRGRLMSLIEVFINVGIVGGYAASVAFEDLPMPSNYRWMLGLGCVAPVLVVGCILKMPESPRWLMSAGLEGEALDVLEHTIGTEDAEQVCGLIKKEIREQDKESSWGKIFDSPDNFRALLITIVLGVLQGLSGIDAVTYYSPKFLEGAGQLDPDAQALSTFVMGICKFSAVIVSTFLIDTVGRRPLLLVSFCGMCFSMAATAVFYAIGAGPTLVLTGMILYVSSFSLGFGPIFWILPTELLPLSARAKGSAAASFLCRSVSAISASAFLTVVSEISLAGVCGVFSFCAFLGLMFTIMLVPETKGRVLESVPKGCDNDKLLTSS